MNPNRNYIKAMYLMASYQELTDGASWYTRAHMICQNISYDLGIDTYKVAAVMSLLSPRNKWERNVIDCQNLCFEWTNGGEADNVSVCTFTTNKTKAWSVLNGASIGDTVKGNKVVAFYALLSKPSIHPVVVDGHAYAIWSGQRLPVTKTPRLNDTLYAAIAQDYRLVADELGIKPHVLQATTWLTYRRIHGVS